MANWIDLEDLPHGLGQNFIAPRAAVQGAVFSSLVFRGRTVRPVYVKPELVAEYGHVKVLQTAGEQLDQGDADVYLELARMAVEQCDPESQLVEVRVNADAFLKRIGRTRGTENRKWLASSISRLKRASFLFEVPGLREWETSFLWDFERNLETKVASEYVIQMNPKLIKVYEAGKTLIKSAERLSLNNDTLAKSLHSFFSSHDKRQESKIGIDKLMVLTGRKSMRKDRFIEGLKESIENLKGATGWAIKLEGEVLKVKQCATAKKEAKPAKPAATKAPATTQAPAAAKPAVKSGLPSWDDIDSVEDLEKLELFALTALMDEQSKATYHATRSKDPLDFEGWKKAALLAIDEQAYMELDRRAYEKRKAELAAKGDLDDDI